MKQLQTEFSLSVKDKYNEVTDQIQSINEELRDIRQLIAIRREEKKRHGETNTSR